MDFALPGFACLMALVFSACAHKGLREALLPSAVAFGIVWLLFVSEWLPAPYAPGYALSIQPEALWAAADAALFAYIVTKAGHTFAGLCIVSLLLCQNVAHLLHWLEALNNSDHRTFLNITFDGEVACFLLSGLPGVIDHVGSWLDRSRHDYDVRMVEVGKPMEAKLERCEDAMPYRPEPDPVEGIHSSLRMLYRID